ncbi:DnaJ domain-containing protein [Candidatus Dependentiae bacterium]|nr:DnaJ domain-containing protein [Candidatus Dependentiae bacterium]
MKISRVLLLVIFISCYSNSFSQNYQSDFGKKDAFNLVLSVVFNDAKISTAIYSDNLYRKNDKKFNKIFKTYLFLDLIDCVFKSKDFGFLADWTFLYDFISIFRKKELNDISKDDFDGLKSEEDKKKLQSFLIKLKNSLFIIDGVSSFLSILDLNENKNLKSFWANIGMFSKILARSIDTKKCSVNKKGLFFTIFPILGSVLFYAGRKIDIRSFLEDPTKFFNSYYSSQEQQFYKNDFGNFEPSRRKDFTFYDLLGINRDASQREISSSFRKLTKKAHPDKGGNCEVYKLLKDAQKYLSDSALKNRYNIWLKNGFSFGEDFHKFMNEENINFFKKLN